MSLKLPPTNYRRQVQSLGRYDNTAPLRLANQNAQQARSVGDAKINATHELASVINRGIGDVTGFMTEYYDSITKREKQTSSQTLMDDINQYKVAFAEKESFTPDEIPEGITHSGGERISKHEVGADMMRQYTQEVIDKQAVNISDPVAREDWVQAMRSVENDQYTTNKLSGIKAHKAEIVGHQDESLQVKIGEGRFGEVRADLDLYTGSSVKKQKWISEANYQQERQEHDRRILSDDTQLIQEGMVLLDGATHMAPAEQISYRQKYIRAMSDNVDSIIYKQDKALQTQVAAFGHQVDQGQVTEQDIHSMWEQGNRYYTVSKYEGDLNKLAGHRNARAKSQFLTKDLVSKWGSTLDPKTHKDHIKVFETRAMATAQKNQTEYDPYTVGASMAQGYGVIPSSTQSAFRAGNNAILDDSQEAQSSKALVEYHNMLKYQPRALNDLSGVELLDRASAFIDIGFSPQEAVSKVRTLEGLSQTQKDHTKEVAQMITKSKDLELSVMEATLHDFVNEKFGETTFGVQAPWDDSALAPDMMQQEFRHLVISELPFMDNNTAAAMRVAFNRLSKTYTMTEINGVPQLMKNAPSQGTVEQMQADVSRTFPDRNVIVGSDTMTERQIREGQTPSYPIIQVNPDNDMEVNFLERWTPKIESYALEDEREQAEKRRVEITDQIHKTNEALFRHHGVRGHPSRSDVILRERELKLRAEASKIISSGMRTITQAKDDLLEKMRGGNSVKERKQASKDLVRITRDEMAGIDKQIQAQVSLHPDVPVSDFESKAAKALMEGAAAEDLRKLTHTTEQREVVDRAVENGTQQPHL